MTRRKYTLRRRAIQQDETRQRILQALIALHEEVGPAQTTVSAIAERAGVQRLTVYRHFPDEASLLNACSSAWLAQNPLPDPRRWQQLADPCERAKTALEALFAYYRATAAMWTSVGRDLPLVPALSSAMRGPQEHLDAIAVDLLRAWPVRGNRRRYLRAVIHHAVQFATWQSLAAAPLGDRAVASLLVGWMERVAGMRRRGR